MKYPFIAVLSTTSDHIPIYASYGINASSVENAFAFYPQDFSSNVSFFTAEFGQNPLIQPEQWRVFYRTLTISL